MNRSVVLRLRQLFLHASDLPPEQRAAFLDAEPDLEADQRQRIEAWLAQLDTEDWLTASSPSRFEPSDPDVIGPYRVLRRIGEGGMGVVYLAEQTTPVARRLAVKRVKAGMGSATMLRRFEGERQALERMEHPAIARLLDAGIDQDGHPYFAMEYVDGQSLIEFCDQRRLDPEARLRLFVEVCLGVQHAHQKGVLHRDLKPSNVLVTTIDGRPVPKIIDFGIAKALERNRVEQTAHTQLGVMLGTPEYMSPEQAEPVNPDVDTRSDVYSLGVMLYELLSGELPFAAEHLRQQGMAGIRRVLQHDDPPRPSTKVRTDPKRTTEHAHQRRLSPVQLAQRLQGDLDWITMCALDKQREQRYASCGELAADIERHLRCEPVLAGPPTLAYRTRKFLTRYRAQATTIALVTCTLLLATAISIWFAVDARTWAQRLDGAQRDLLMEKRAVEAVLDRAAGHIGQGAGAGSSPAAEARQRAMIGEAYSALGRHADALDNLHRSLRLLQFAPDVSAREVYSSLRFGLLVQAAWATFADRLTFLARFARTANAVMTVEAPELAPSLQALAALPTANAGRQTIDRVFAQAERHLPPQDPRWLVLADLLSLQIDAGADRTELGKRVLATYERLGLPSIDPGWLRARLLLVQHGNTIGNHGIACDLALAALADIQGKLPSGHWYVGAMHFQLGYGMFHRDRLADAEREFRTARSVFDRELGPDNAWAVTSVWWTFRCHDRQGDEAEAQALRQELAQRIRRSSYHGNTTAWVEAVLGPGFASLIRSLAALDDVRRDPVAALPRLDDVLTQCRTTISASDVRAAAVARWLTTIGNDLSNSGAHSAAMRRLFEYSDEVLRATGGERGRSAHLLAHHCYVLGDVRAGERAAALASGQRGAHADPSDHASLRSLLGLCRFELGGGEVALDLALDGYRGLVDTLGVTDDNTSIAFARTVSALHRAGNRTRAMQLADERLQQLVQDGGTAQAFWSQAWTMLWNLGDDERSARSAAELERRFAEDFRAPCARAHLAAVRFDEQQAIDLAARALASASDNWYCNSVLASVYCRLGMASESDACARRAVALRNTAEQRHQRSVLLLRLGEADRAQTLLERLVEDHPDYAPGHANLSSCLRRRGDLTGALAAAKHAFRLQPTAGREALARVRLALGEDATDLLEQQAAAADRPSGDGFWPDYTLAMLRAGKLDEARQRLERLTTEWPTEPYAWSARALALATTAGLTAADRDTALACAQEAVARSHRQGPVMLATLAEVHHRLGDSESALAVLDECHRAMRGRNAEWLTLAEVKERRLRYAAPGLRKTEKR